MDLFSVWCASSSPVGYWKRYSNLHNLTWLSLASVDISVREETGSFYNITREKMRAHGLSTAIGECVYTCVCAIGETAFCNHIYREVITRRQSSASWIVPSGYSYRGRSWRKEAYVRRVICGIWPGWELAVRLTNIFLSWIIPYIFEINYFIARIELPNASSRSAS